MTFPDRVSVFHKLAERPRDGADSFTLDVLILSDRWRRAAARCSEDIVMYDYRKAKKMPLPGFMAAAYEGTWELQEEERRVQQGKVQDILARVTALEKETWDREDAVEDMGRP